MKKILTLAAGALIGLSASLPAEAAAVKLSAGNYTVGSAIARADQLKTGKYFIYAYSKGVGRYVHKGSTYMADKGLEDIPEAGTTDASYIYDITVNDNGTFTIANDGVAFPINGHRDEEGKGDITVTKATETGAVAAEYTLSTTEVTGKPTASDFADKDKLFYVQLANATYEGGGVTAHIITNTDDAQGHFGYWGNCTGDISNVDQSYTALAFYPAIEPALNYYYLIKNARKNKYVQAHANDAANLSQIDANTLNATDDRYDTGSLWYFVADNQATAVNGFTAVNICNPLKPGLTLADTQPETWSTANTVWYISDEQSTKDNVTGFTISKEASATANGWNDFGGNGTSVGYWGNDDSGSKWLFESADYNKVIMTFPGEMPDMPANINLDPTKTYLMSLKGHDGLNMQMLNPKNGTHVTISESIVAPVRVVPKRDGTVAILCCDTGLFLGYSKWNSIYNSAAAASWTIAATEDAGETYYTLYQNGANPGYLGCSVANCADGAEIWTNVANNSSELINWKFTEVSSVDMTVNFQIDGNTYSSTVIKGFEGASYTIEYPPFTTGDPLTSTFNLDVTSINVPVTVVLPFKYSETEDWNNLTWQAIEPHGNQAPYKWTYTEDKITDTQVAHASATGYSDEQLWAFIGNLIDGFKIVNKAAGQGKYVTYSDGIGKVIEQTEPSLWMAKPTTAYSEVNKFVCFQPKGGTGYLNHNTGNQNFASYGLADQGSSNEFFAPADPLIGYYDSNFRDNTVGFSTATESLQAAVTAAEAERYNTVTAAALASELAKDYEQIVFDPAKWYRLENVASPNTYLVAGSDNNRNIWGGETSERTNPYSIVKFEAVPEQTDRYYIADQGLYFGHVTGTASKGNDVMQVEATGERGEFTITTLGAGKHAFRDATSTSEEYYRYLHYAEQQDNKVVGWGSGDVKSQWYIHPANDLDLDMTLSMQFDGKKIGTGYFPFPVKATGSAKLYYVTESKSRADNSPVMTYNEVSSVPAATAFIVMSESNDVTLAIDYDGISALAEPENVLAGTYRAATATAGDYVFTGTAFEKLTDAPAIGSNSAYVPKEAVSNQELSSYPFVKPDMTTGINEIGVATSGKQVIYDLQGRRVQRASKGLYIINGVKTLVK